MSGFAAHLAALLAAASLAPGVLPVLPPTPLPPPRAGAVSPAGKTVAAIDLRAPQPLRDAQRLLGMIDLEIGQPWRDDTVRRTLRNFYLTGSVSEAEAYAEPVPGDANSVRAIFAVWPSTVVRTVHIVGKLGLPAADLRRVVAVRAAEPLVEDQVLRSVASLEDLYQEFGYRAAKVHLRVHQDAAASATDVTFEVDAGPRTVVRAVTLAGDLGSLHAEDVLKKASSKAGKPYRRSIVREDSDRIQRALNTAGYRLAEVDPAHEESEASGNGVRLTFPVRLGPRIDVVMRGADLPSLRKKGLLPFLGSEGYDEALVLQAIDRIRADFQSRGYYQVKVEKREDRTPDLVRLTLTVEPGGQFVLDSVRFKGNAGVPESKLSQLMTTSSKRLLSPGSGRLVDAVLKEDLANIRSFYALQGYTRARVGPEIVEVKGHSLALTIPVIEGRRSLVGTISLHGAVSVPEATLRQRLVVREGGPFHPLLLQDSVNALRSLYDDLGFDAVQISSTVGWDEDKTVAAIAIDVLEGPQNRLDRVIIRGNVKTQERVIRRFIDLEEGDPVSRQRLLELQREIYRLGVFSRVDFDLLSTADDSALRDVRLRLEEGAFQRYTYGVGYDSEKGASGAVGYSHVNLFGRALTVQGDVKVSQQDRQYRVLFSQPYLGSYRLPVRVSLFGVEEQQKSFDSRRRGLQVEVERQIGSLRLGGLYTYKLVNTINLAPDISIDQIERDLTPVEIASVTASALYDRRDDPIDPHRGYSLASQLEYAFPLFSANERFLKVISQATYQRPVGQLGVIAGSVRLGAIEALSRICQPGVAELDAASCPIPLSERFFAGGRSTHRAYRRDALGIPGDTLNGTTPAGGTGLALVNLDYRFPVYGAFGGVVFVDSGNVWGDWRNIRPGDLKTGVGLGVRYGSPVGPIRVEVGWKLDRARGESPYEVYFSFGTPF